MENKKLEDKLDLVIELLRQILVINGTHMALYNIEEQTLDGDSLVKAIKEVEKDVNKEIADFKEKQTTNKGE